MRRPECWQISAAPSLSLISPFGPTNEPGGASVRPPAFSIRTLTDPSGDHWRTTFPTTSLNQSTPSVRHTGPSVNWNPPASFSILASFGTRASSAGSTRRMLPAAGGSLGGGASDWVVGVVEHPALRSATAHIMCALVIEFRRKVYHPEARRRWN